MDTLIQKRKTETKNYEALLREYEDLSKLVLNPSDGVTYPKSLNSAAKRALYDNLGNNEELPVALNKDILATRKDNWRGNVIKEREVLYAIQKYITDDAKPERVFEWVKNQGDY